MKLPAWRAVLNGAAQGPASVSSRKGYVCAYEMGDIGKLEGIASAEEVQISMLEILKWIPKPNGVWPQHLLPRLLVLGHPRDAGDAAALGTAPRALSWVCCSHPARLHRVLWSTTIRVD